MRTLDLKGKVFGRLTALREDGRDLQGRAMWLCRCSCGNEKRVASRHLRSGAIISCGCYVRSLAADNARRGAHKITGSLSPLHKQVVGYGAAHGRVRKVRGRACNHACVDCGGAALHWSYNLTDPDELVSPGGQRYSLDPAHYSPRCTPCHSAHDRSN